MLDFGEESMKFRMIEFGVACFVLGVVVQTVVAQKGKAPFDTSIYEGKDAKAAATALLDQAKTLAGTGSWERIAVGRAWYLGGDKAKGQAIFDEVTGGKKVASSDWVRLGRIYVESNEWDKAQNAFDKALALEPNDDGIQIEYGAFANVKKDRMKAEMLFGKAFNKSSKDFWHWVGAGASYLGVNPN
jgi:tetratricopeptide (TPR) repeat protein